jgi:hypothetical protein
MTSLVAWPIIHLARADGTALPSGRPNGTRRLPRRYDTQIEAQIFPAMYIVVSFYENVCVTIFVYFIRVV